MAIQGVNIFGPVQVASGLGSAVRSHVTALRAAGVRLRIFPFQFSSKQGAVPFDCGSEEGFFDIAIAYANADATEFFLSLFGRRFKGARYRIGVWVWELPAADPRHLAHTKMYDEIWVPSTFNQRAFSAVTRIPVKLLPYAVALPSPSARNYRRELGIAEDAYVFLYMFDASSFVQRKNPTALIKAFVDAFRGDAAVRLVLKISYLPENAPFQAELRAAQAALPTLHVVREVLGEADLAALVSCADCYVSPHRSEGFGFTLAEAMLLGKPAIATNYGSTTDFINERTGFPVPYRLVEVGANVGGPYHAGAVWADVAPEELARVMRWVRGHPEEARVRAQAGREAIARQYSHASIGRAIAQRLSEISAHLHGEQR